MILTDKVSAKILDELQKGGADMAECFASESVRTELNAESGKFTLFRTNFGISLSIKAVCAGKKGSTTINSLEDEDVRQAIEAVLASAASSRADEAEGVAEPVGNGRFVYGNTEADKAVLFDRMAEFMGSVSKEYPSIVLESMNAEHIRRDTLYTNTLGVSLSSLSGNYSVSTMFSAKDGESTSSFNYSDATDDRLDRLLMEMGMQRTLLEENIRQIHPVNLGGKFTGPVLVTPACMDFLLYYILSNFASDGPLIDGTSIWKNSLNQPVASPALTLRANPLDSAIFGAERITPDGYPAANMNIIENGVLKNYLLGRYGSKKTGFARSANPGDGLMIDPGNRSLDEMIAGIDNGILLCRFSGGAPAPNGDFSGVAKNSFLIKNGRIADAVSETMISGNMAQMLRNISAISRERVSTGMSVLPYLRFDGLTISGR